MSKEPIYPLNYKDQTTTDGFRIELDKIMKPLESLGTDNVEKTIDFVKNVEKTSDIINLISEFIEKINKLLYDNISKITKEDIALFSDSLFSVEFYLTELNELKELKELKEFKESINEIDSRMNKTKSFLGVIREVFETSEKSRTKKELEMLRILDERKWNSPPFSQTNE